MATGNSTTKSCYKCNQNRRSFTCDGCHRAFCFEHVNEHHQELSQRMNDIEQEYDVLKRDLSQQDTNKTLLMQTDSWEKESIEIIQDIAKTIRTEIKRTTEEITIRLSNSMNILSDELRSSRQSDEYTEDDLGRWMKQLEECRKEVEKPSKVGYFRIFLRFFIF